ncbi:DUF6503 family protein [Tamlana sp. 2201CG12-4]|uniref:DUF6503 family protein n=1 Tax=Tamlana sp. 2201CG12-4 TaxID=3112582 RepID=UPI002DC004D2|nr:DUF6503 family protein [Tamlana sp. 2201CG12-4]MEC3907810.1 DUF6503 family protein [Tamlana sp. 2201CG12-4]
MTKPLLVFSVLSVLIFNCKQSPVQNANHITDKSIEISGGELLKRSAVKFDFRDKHYTAIRDNGSFVLERTFINDSVIVADKLSNNGFERLVDNKPAKIPDSMIPRYSASVNSVHYFSVLPYGLNDAAVNKDYIGKATVKNENYHKIKVTFNQEGGGEDFEDVFVYWVNSKNYKVDYLAYSYSESHGIGLRFREAYNERFVKGIRFVDYNNFRSADTNIKLEELDMFFEKGQLELLSKIELKNIEVNLLSVPDA